MESFCLLSLVVLLLFTTSDAAPVSDAAPTVTIDSGAVFGVATSLAGAKVTVDKYLGIPFAAPPVRFAPAVKPTPWEKPFNATQYGPACFQAFNYPEAARNASMTWYNTPPPPAGESEDCLNLNVFVPRTGSKNKTVLAWIYGGSLRIGYNSHPVYDGSYFAANQDVIIVALNYRTNVFGFPNSPELPFTERNLGFLDQRFALDWIQRNIATFGGDPKKVTIFGESAGAGSVDVLVTTMATNPPFRAAIMQSGQATSYVNTTNAPVGWLTLSAVLNCTQTHPSSNLTCLRNQTALTLKNTIERLAIPFRPVTDNVTTLRYPEAARLNRSVANVPILAGTNANEATSFIVGQTNATAYVGNLFPGQTELVNTILSAYPATGADQVEDFVNDLTFLCPLATYTNDSRAAGFPTWRYFYNTTFPNIRLAGLPNAGVFHSSEISIVFGTYPRVNATEYERALSHYMQTAWATFAKNPQGGPGWQGVPVVASLGTGGVLNTPTSTGALDKNCYLYREIFEKLGIAPKSEL